MGPNLKGAIAEAEIAAAAIALGIPVYTPVAEHGRCDLILDIGSRPLRVQCKWGGLDSKAGLVKIRISGSRLTPSGYVRRRYTETEIDAMAVYCGELDRCYLVPKHLVVNREALQLRLSPPLNGQRACINLASDYEFAGAVAQLEERLNGIQEAEGSSPSSSTPASTLQVGAHEFRNLFGYFMERAAAGQEIFVTRRGKPYVRLCPASTMDAANQQSLPIAA